MTDSQTNRKKAGRFAPYEYLWFVGGALLVFWIAKTCALVGEDYGTHSRIAESLNLKDPLSILRSHSEFMWHVTARVIAAVLRRIGLAGRYGDGIVVFSGTLASGFFVALAFLLTCYFLHRNVPGMKAWQIALLGLIIHVSSSIYLPWFSRTPYRGQDSFNPWHNPTNIALRPFMILFMSLLGEDLNRAVRSGFRERPRAGRVALLAFLLLLTNMAKPSFAQGFLPAIFLMMIIWLFRYQKKNLKFALEMMVVCIPSACYMLLQILINFGSDSKRGVQIKPFAVAAHASNFIPLSILLLQAFSLTMLILVHSYERKTAYGGIGGKPVVSFDAEHELSLLTWSVALVEKMLLAEKGYYIYHGNFGWAYCCASAWCFYVAVRDYAKIYIAPGHPGRFRSRGFIIATAVLALHLASGIYYIYWIIGLGHTM